MVYASPPNSSYIVLLAKDLLSGDLVEIKTSGDRILVDAELVGDLLAKEAKQDAILEALGDVLLKLSSDPSTAALQGSANTLLSGVASKLIKVEQLHANIDFSSASPYTTIAAPGAGYRIRIVQLILMSGAPTPVNFEVAIKSGSTTIKTIKASAIAIDSPEHCNLGTNEALVLQATTADRIVGGVDYYLEAV